MFSWSALNQLRQYEPGSDPNRLLTDFNQNSLPCRGGRSGALSDPRGSSQREMEGWDFGATNLAKLIATARKGTQISNPSQDVVVEVPSLGCIF